MAAFCRTSSGDYRPNTGRCHPRIAGGEQLIEANELHAAGFVSYEAATAFDSVLHTLPDSDFPFLWFGLYPGPREFMLQAPEYPKETLSWEPTINRASYNNAIYQIRNHIAEGRTYQVNYTMRLRTDFEGNPWEFFLHLVQSQNRHAAYIDSGRHVICSASPELFFELDGDKIFCRPMKGTVKRGRTTIEEQTQSEQSVIPHSGK